MNKYLTFVKFSHTLFALPFAIVGFFLALYKDGGPSFDWGTFALVLACMVFARNAAMGFNRYADRYIDAKNPRTADRHLPQGTLSPGQALLFVGSNSLLFILAAYWINTLCFMLSPIALAVILGYSYSKRFTWLCHFILGIGLSLAPIGAYLAVTSSFDLFILILGASVLLWTAGFDIIYALQDEEFDQEHQLYSMPAYIGKENALRWSSIIHLMCALFLLWFASKVTSTYTELSWLTWSGSGIFLLLLLYQHRIVSSEDLQRVNLAFFTTNGVASITYAVFLIIDLYV